MKLIRKFVDYMCERTVEVPEHYYDWMAPRWYIAICVFAYIAMITGMVLSFVPLFQGGV